MNVYLISIESYHLIDLEVKKIIKDNQVIKYNLNKSNIKEVIEEANYFSLTALFALFFRFLTPIFSRFALFGGIWLIIFSYHIS